MQKAKVDPSAPQSSIDFILRTPEDKAALRAAIAEGQASIDRGEVVSAEESRRRTRALIERCRSNQ